MREMTDEQALHCLKAEYDDHTYCCNCKLREKCNRFDSSVKTDYAEIAYQKGAEALEKQIPKKITHHGCYDNKGVWHTWVGIDGVPYDLCPNCSTNLCTEGKLAKEKMNYCEKCGQKLDWGDEDE